jgi:hypothetical protein
MGWLSFYGLLVELIGFLLLSYDLLPEYRLHRSREISRRYRFLLDKPEWFENEKKTYDSYSGDGPMEAVAGLAHVMSLDDLRHLMYRHGIGRDFSIPVTHEEMRLAYKQLDVKLDELAIKTANRVRPPILIAIWVALIGIMMQLFAAYPR